MLQYSFFALIRKRGDTPLQPVFEALSAQFTITLKAGHLCPALFIYVFVGSDGMVQCEAMKKAAAAFSDLQQPLIDFGDLSADQTSGCTEELLDCLDNLADRKNPPRKTAGQS